MAESKSRLLYILKYLWQNTDAEHYATTADILAFLKGNGISCDRKTIPGDIAKLCDIGIDIEEERSRENRYSLSSHLFTLPELKLLIDAVESSKFITVKKSAELIEKLSQMTSIHQAAELKSNLYVSERVKPLNEQIYYLVDTVIAAMTTVIKKRYLPSHIILGDRFGLKEPSMVMLEQLRTVNQADLLEYIGRIDDEHCMKKINIGVKKALGLWVDKPYRKPADMRCLCVKCLESYKNSPNYIVKRLDPFAKAKDKCDKCQSYGYDYLVIERSKEG